MKAPIIAIATYLFSNGVEGFSVSPLLPANSRSSLCLAASSSDLPSPPPTPVDNVIVLKDADAVGKHHILQSKFVCFPTSQPVWRNGDFNLIICTQEQRSVRLFHRKAKKPLLKEDILHLQFLEGPFLKCSQGIFPTKKSGRRRQHFSMWTINACPWMMEIWQLMPKRESYF